MPTHSTTGWHCVYTLLGYDCDIPIMPITVCVNTTPPSLAVLAMQLSVSIYVPLYTFTFQLVDKCSICIVHFSLVITAFVVLA